MDATKHNYKNPNHKPKLIFTLTPFLTINTFHKFSKIISLLQPITNTHPTITHFLQQPNTKHLNKLFTNLLNIQNKKKSHTLTILKSTLNNQQNKP